MVGPVCGLADGVCVYIQVIGGLTLGHKELGVETWDETGTYNLKRTLSRFLTLGWS